jgi:hypothetical protein
MFRFCFLHSLCLLNLSPSVRPVGAPPVVTQESTGTSSGPSSSGLSVENAAVTRSLKARALASGVWSPSDMDSEHGDAVKHHTLTRAVAAAPSLLSSDTTHPCSPKMWKILSAANPLVSLAEMRQVLGMSSDEVGAHYLDYPHHHSPIS